MGKPITLLAVVGIFRRCRRCLRWRRIGNFTAYRRPDGRVGLSYACARCRKYFRKYEGRSGLYTITDQGRRALREQAA